MGTHHPYRHRQEAATAGVEVLAHVRGMLQLAVEVVGPLVIGADQHAYGGLARLPEPRAPVPADVAKGPDVLVVVAHQDDGGLADVEGGDIARLGDVRGHADHDPVPVVEDLEVRGEDVLPAIQLAG